MLIELLTAAIVGGSSLAAPAVNLTQGERYGEIIIPRLQERETIRQGANLPQLDVAVGHLPQSKWPGQNGLISLWGHRVTPVNGRTHGPFRYINKLKRDDQIIIKHKNIRYFYQVIRSRIIEADSWRTFRPRDKEILTIAACHPVGSAAYRYVVFAKRL